MTTQTSLRQPTASRMFVLATRTTFAVVMMIGLAGPAGAQTGAAWERKLDRALQVAADVDADTARRVTVRLARTAPADKARTLAAIGFPVLAAPDARTVVVGLSAREAMVLAEDGELDSFTLASPVAGDAASGRGEARTSEGGGQ